MVGLRLMMVRIYKMKSGEIVRTQDTSVTTGLSQRCTGGGMLVYPQVQRGAMAKRIWKQLREAKFNNNRVNKANLIIATICWAFAMCQALC